MSSASSPERLNLTGWLIADRAKQTCPVPGDDARREGWYVTF
jgi:hypothetical protein